MKDSNVLSDVLFLPGLLCDERLWAAQMEALVGSARSRTFDLTAYESIAAMADAVLSSCSEPVCLGWILDGRVCRTGGRWPSSGPRDVAWRC